jgi:hypothetical protein
MDGYLVNPLDVPGVPEVVKSFVPPALISRQGAKHA